MRIGSCVRAKRRIGALAGAVAAALPGVGLAFDRTFNVSLVSQFNPPITPIGNQYADLARQGNLVALGSVAGDGVAFVDISNITAPSHDSYYNPLPASTGGHFQDIEFKGDYAFCAVDDSGSTNGGIHVLDLTKPAPVKVAHIYQGIANDNGFHRNHTVFLDGNYLYATSNQISTVKVFDVTNPANPSFVRDIITAGPAGDKLHQVTVKNGRLYTSNITNGLLEIYDISDVASGSWTEATRKLGSFTTPTQPGVTPGRNHSSWPSEDGKLLAICHETLGGDVQLWDISNPGAPTMLSRIDGTIAGVDGFSPHNPVIVGDTMYVSWYQAGLQIFNIRDPSAPAHLGAYDTFTGGYPGPSPYLGAYDGNWGVDVSMGVDKILLSNIDDGLYVVNATDAFKKRWTYEGDDGKWQQDIMWGGGPIPNSSEMTALFTDPVTGPIRTVTVDSALTPVAPRVAAIEFLSSMSYVIQPAGSVEIEMLSSDGSASIVVNAGADSSGTNRITVPLLLSDDLLVTNNSAKVGSPALELGSIRGTDRTISFQGGGETALTAASPSFSGSIVVNGGGKLRLTNGQAVNGASITLAGGTLALRNNTSTHFFSNVNATDNASLIVGNNGSPTDSSAGNPGGGGQVHSISNITVAAGKTLTLSRENNAGLAAVNVTLNGTLAVAPGGASATALKVNTLNVPPGKLDLADAKLVMTATPVGTWTGSSYSFVTGWIAQGRNGGAWNGTSGIVTSMTNAISSGDLTTIGIATVSQALGIAPAATANWFGQTVAGTDALLAYTWGGDANLDGKINIDDYGRIDGNVASSGSVFGWFNGDFNYDGKINIDDYGIIDGNINRQGDPLGAGGTLDGAAAVPEPIGVAFVGVASLLFARRRGPGASGD